MDNERVGTWTDSEDASVYGGNLLRGDTVRLRRLREDDLSQLDEWWADPQWSGLQQLLVRPRPDGATADMFRKWSVNTSPGDVGFSICDLLSDELIGHGTLLGAQLPIRAASLALMLAPGHIGRGYGTDAVKTLVRYGFLEMGLNRIELRVWGYNSRARRAYAKAGFREEGIRREVAFHDGTYHDEVIMSVLRSEWEASR